MKTKLKTKKEKTEWGYRWYVNDVEERFKFALYRYDDDLETLYLSDIDVFKEYQGQGLGNKILEIAENTARKWNAKRIRLWCNKKSFVFDWYKRHGYEDMNIERDDTPGYEWLEKELDNE